MTGFPVTSTYAALLALLLLVLSLLVIRQRLHSRVAIGTEGGAALLRAARAQGNFTEYVPVILVLLLLLEAGGASAGLLHGLGATTLLGRVLHGFGISRSPERLRFRQAGMALTFGPLAAAAVALLLR